MISRLKYVSGLLVALALIYFFVISPYGVNSLFNLATQRNSGFSVNEIKEVSKLATVEYLGEVRVKFDESITITKYELNVPGTKKRYLAFGQGRVVAGIDAEKITDFSNHQGVITLRLPAAEILYREINQDSWEVWDEANGIFTKISANDIHAAEFEAIDGMVARAIEHGILEAAQVKAQRSIETLLVASGASKVVFL